MSRIGMPLSLDRLDAPLSAHFGKAKWLAVLEAGAAPRFVRNEGLDGRWVAQALALAGVTDVVAGHMGGGAFGHLAAAGLRVWQGDATTPAGELARRCVAGELPPFEAPAPGATGAATAPGGPDHGHAGGCGCGGHGH